MTHNRQMGFLWGILAGGSATAAFTEGAWFMLIFAAMALYFCWSFDKRIAQ